MTVHYERLSNLDASFLALETRTTHMHVGAVALFAPGPSVSDHGVDITTIRQLILGRLDSIPRYRQRLATVPIEGSPVWVDDEYFHLDYHVRHIALPRPGSTEQLKDLVGRLMSQQLDRSKPLWELYIVEGLEDGGFALVAKIHHCMIDGISGIDLMAVLLDFAPEFELTEPKPWTARPAPNGTELAVREISRSISSLLAGIVKAPTEIGSWTSSWSDRARAAGASLSSGWLSQTDKTSLNGPIGGSRTFDWLQLPLADVKKIKSIHGATVNDVMLAVVAGAVRSYLVESGGLSEEDLAETEFRIMAPVSVRTRDESGTLGNKVAMWLMTLPIYEPDPAKRVQIVTKETRNLKETDQALGASTLVEVSTGAPATLVSLAARLAGRARPFNMTVTNVPGPRFPLYMAGSQMLATYPLVPLWQSHGAGIAMFSMNGMIDIGINMDRDLIQDPSGLRRYIQAAFDELMDVKPAEKKKAKKRPPMGTP
ncbi:MAG: wax ester/triacylglycerol synthase family O-acyltransferase [Acidimicrobiia bacterium]|nr:MAG: wax ester/triacylglycerol synthase family O-acyltransferase [Acidimicrobiia bacterium]